MASRREHVLGSAVALAAVLGARATAELLGVSPSGYAEIIRMLDHFNESADLTKSAILPYGWRLVPCPPTERMLKAVSATWPCPPVRRQESVFKRLQDWLYKRRQEDPEDPLEWLEEHRGELTTSFLAMVDEAPPPPWTRG